MGYYEFVGSGIEGVDFEFVYFFSGQVGVELSYGLGDEDGIIVVVKDDVVVYRVVEESSVYLGVEVFVDLVGYYYVMLEYYVYYVERYILGGYVDVYYGMVKYVREYRKGLLMVVVRVCVGQLWFLNILGKE